MLFRHVTVDKAVHRHRLDAIQYQRPAAIGGGQGAGDGIAGAGSLDTDYPEGAVKLKGQRRCLIGQFL